MGKAFQGKGGEEMHFHKWIKWNFREREINQYGKEKRKIENKLEGTNITTFKNNQPYWNLPHLKLHIFYMLNSWNGFIPQPGNKQRLYRLHKGKSAVPRMSYFFFGVTDQWGLISLQIIQAISNIFVYSPELDSKTALMKTPHTWLVKNMKK